MCSNVVVVAVLIMFFVINVAVDISRMFVGFLFELFALDPPYNSDCRRVEHFIYKIGVTISPCLSKINTYVICVHTAKRGDDSEGFNMIIKCSRKTIAVSDHTYCFENPI